MLVVGYNLWPSAARRVAWQHNERFHDGVPTAHIDVDKKSTDIDPSRPPRYKVCCPVCGRQRELQQPRGWPQGRQYKSGEVQHEYC